MNAALSRSRLSRDGFESRPVRKNPPFGGFFFLDCCFHFCIVNHATGNANTQHAIGNKRGKNKKAPDGQIDLANRERFRSNPY